MDYGKATDSMKMSMTQATIERNKAVQNLANLKQQVQQLERDKDQVETYMYMICAFIALFVWPSYVYIQYYH